MGTIRSRIFGVRSVTSAFHYSVTRIFQIRGLDSRFTDTVKLERLYRFQYKSSSIRYPSVI